MKKLILNLRIQKLGICMRKNICLGMGATLAFAMSVYAQNYKINKVGSDEEQSFNVMLNQTVVSEAPAGSWLSVTPIIPDGKVFKGFTVYDAYGDARDQRTVSTTEKNDAQFLMPNHDVYVTASFESLRYFLIVKNTDNGNVSLAFNDRYRDRTKPGTRVTVSPSAANGFKLASIRVSKNLDDGTIVPCTQVEPGSQIPGMWGMGGSAVEGSCAFDMPNFDVEVVASFVAESVDLSSSSAEESSSSSEQAASSSSSVIASSSSSEVVVSSSSSATPASSSSVKVESSSSAKPASSSSAKAASSSSAKPASSSSAKVESSSSAKPASSSSVKVESSSSSKPASSSSAKAVSSSSAKPASSSSAKAASSSSAKPASSSSTKAASSSSAKSVSSSSAKAASSSSAKAASSSSKKASSSSAKPASSSSKKSTSSSSKAVSSSSVIPDIVVEAVGTEEDMPSCTVKRENMTYYVTELKTVFVCKSRIWTKFNPGMKLEKVAPIAKFTAVVNGRNLQVTGAKMGANVNLLDMQGRVIYNARVDAANFSVNVPQSGAYVLRIGSEQRIVNAR